MTIDLDTAIQQFLSKAAEFQADNSLSPERVLDWLVGWYRETRIAGAALEKDGDMLLLQWGVKDRLLADSPVEFRGITDGTYARGEEEPYIDFTRQIFDGADDDEAEFDDGAIQLSLTFGYDGKVEKDRSSNLWIETPAAIAPRLASFHSKAFVRELIGLPVGRFYATVNPIG